MRSRFNVAFVFCFILCFYGLEINAQWTSNYLKKVPGFESYSQTIYDMYINKKGLLHLGTDKGLMTYNGILFKTYPFKDNLALSLNRIQEDNQNMIWGKNFSNQLFYLEKDTLRPRKNVEKFFNEINQNLIDFIFFKDTLYLLTEQNLYKETAQGKIKPVLSTSEAEGEVFHRIYELNENLVLAGNDKIFEFNGDQITGFYKALVGQKELMAYKGELFYILKGAKNEIISLTNGAFSKADIPDKTYFYDLLTTANALWLTTTKGLFKLDTNRKSIEDHVLPGARVNTIVQDLEGGYWISTLDEGLFYMPYYDITQLNHKDSSNTTYNFITLEKDDNEHLFAGSSNGVIVEFSKALKPIFEYSASNNVDVEYIYTDNTKIISTVGVFKKRQPKAVLDTYFGKGISKDDLGNYIFANYNSAGLIPSKLKGLPTIPNQLQNANELPFFSDAFQMYMFRSKRSRVVHYSKKYKSYYIGFSDGLYKYGQDGSVFEIKTIAKRPIVALDFEELANGDLSVASVQEGLIIVSDRAVKHQVDVSKGLSSNSLKRLRTDTMGIWIQTDNGIDYYNLEKRTVRNYDCQLGLSDVRINDFIVHDNALIFATNNGLLYFDQSLLDQSFIPVLEIDVLQNNKPIFSGTTLNHDQNQVAINFNTIYYKPQGKYEYEYQLKPIHNQWQTQSASQPLLNFLALEPNAYQLLVRIKTGTSVSASQEFNFTIAKPFYNKPWFYSIAVVLFLALLVLVHKLAVIKTNKKKSITELLAISQLTALRSQMNPHFMFNVLNAVQGLIYSNQKSKASDYLGTFSTLMRKTLDISDKRDITIAQEIETIKLYVSLEQARFEDNEFTYIVLLPDEDLEQYTIPSLIIQPFVENAIKHGLMHKAGQKKLQIEVLQKNEQYWEFIIEDNGIGREASTQINKKITTKHASFATKAVENRINLMNKLMEQPIKLHIEDLRNALNESMGTRATIQIPVRQRMN